MKSDKKYIIIFIIIFIVGLALRIYQFSFFEFKNDQFFAIQLGNDTRNANFMITHGMLSGVGVNNPPLFLYLMGIITSFTNDPLYITAIFLFFNILALLFAMRYFYVSLPKTYAVFTSILLSFSPAFIMYSSTIWAQCFVPFVMVIFHICLYNLIKNNRYFNFLYLTILFTIASQLHMSGFFLLPALIIIALYYRNKISKKIFILSAICVFIIYLPYLFYLFLGGGLWKFISYGASSQRNFSGTLFLEQMWMSSFDFFRYYFGNDFYAVLNRSLGALRFILYPLSLFLMVFFILGLIDYLKWLLRARKLFQTDSDASGRYPLPFQISGLMVLSITLGYLLFRIEAPMHYFIVLFPCYSLISGYSAYKVWNLFLGRLITYLSIASTLILLVSALHFLDNSGGYPYEYGPSFRALLNLEKEAWSNVPVGHCPDLSVNFEGEGKSDKEAALFVFWGNHRCIKNNSDIPVKINIIWNEDLMRYEGFINSEKNERG